MPQEITRTQIEKYTVYTGPTAESYYSFARDG